jgi:3-oxoacyl-[acyl-carrier protein] reductase
LGADRGRSIAVPYALEDPSAAEQVLAHVMSSWDRIDIVVHCAVRRGQRPAGRHFEDVPVDEWDPGLAGDLSAAIRLSQLSVGAMRARGWGRLVLLSSHVVRNGHAGQEFYAAGKAALHGLVRSLAWDAGRSGILANVVCPGLTTTEGVLGKLPASVREAEAALTPTGRLSDPADVAGAIAFLCSGANRNITGSVVPVSGGR